MWQKSAFLGLFRGRSLSEDDFHAVAAKLAAYSGLTPEDYEKVNLRLNYQDFCKTLLADQKLVIGRIDGRFTGPLTSGHMIYLCEPAIAAFRTQAEAWYTGA